MSLRYRRSPVSADGTTGTGELKAWHGLARAVDAPPYVRPGWFLTWAEVFGSGAVELHGLWRDDELVAAAPLDRVPYGRRSPTNVHSGEYRIVARHRDDAVRLAETIIAREPRLLMLALLWPDARSVLDDAAGRAERVVTHWPQHESPRIDTTGPLDAYLAGRDGRWLKQLDRRRRRLERQGDLRLDILERPDDLEPLLDACFALEAAGWKGASGTAMQSRPDTDRFYRQIARWAAGEGALRLALLRLDERVVAFDLCLENDTVHYFLKTGYDEELRSEAPGMLLRRMMIERAFETGLRRYELLGAAEDWKMRWATDTSPVVRALVSPASPLGAAARGAMGMARAARRPLRRAREALPV